MNTQNILFETFRFNFSEVKDNFINPCCFGEDVALWLQQKLEICGKQITALGQEDWGWYIEIISDGSKYFIAIGSESTEVPSANEYGEWHLVIE